MIFQEFSKQLRRRWLFASIMYSDRFIGRIIDREGKVLCRSSGQTKGEAEQKLMENWFKY